MLGCSVVVLLTVAELGGPVEELVEHLRVGLGQEGLGRVLVQHSDRVLHLGMRS